MPHCAMYCPIYTWKIEKNLGNNNKLIISGLLYNWCVKIICIYKQKLASGFACNSDAWYLK